MLKYVVGGREPYNKAIKYYLEKHKYQNVDTKDLLIAFEETTGMSLDWFFEEWLYKGGLPDYNVSYTEEDKSTQFLVTQMQEQSPITGLPVSGENNTSGGMTDEFVSAASSNYRPEGLFKMPIWFEVHYSDGTAAQKQVWIEKQVEKVSIPNPVGKKIDFVLFDPGNHILKTVSFHKSFEMLASQAEKAYHMLDRLDAVEAMRTIPPDEKRELLIKLFNKESFYAVKSVIISQLINDDAASSRELIRNALNDKDVQVRKAVINNTKEIPAKLLPGYEKLLNDSSYDIILSAIDKLVESNPLLVENYLNRIKGVTGTVGRNVEIKWLELSAIHDSGTGYTDKLVDYTSNSYEFRTRVNAMQALKRLNYFNEELLTNLTSALSNPNTRLSNPAAETLQYFYAQDKWKNRIESWSKTDVLEPAQLTALKKIIN
jgi:aminopeptidase N